MLKRLRQSFVVPFAAWLLLGAGISASAEMALDSVHVHAAVATAVAGHGAAVSDPVNDGPDGWHLPGGAGCSSAEAGDCTHCQHTSGMLVHPSLPASVADTDNDLPASRPTAAVAMVSAQPPQRPPIA